MPHTVELVRFKIFDDAEPNFLAANAAINEWLRQQPGFISRQLARKTDGEWIDIVVWESEHAAKTAAANMLPEMGDTDAMKAIDPSTVAIDHAAVGLTFPS